MARRAHAAVTAALLLVALVLAAPVAESAVTSCGQVVGNLAPCLGYAMGSVAAPTWGCCRGVRSLHAAAATTADRRATCSCLKQQTSGMGGIRPDLAAGIPTRCGVNLPYPISASIDCSRVR